MISKSQTVQERFQNSYKKEKKKATNILFGKGIISIAFKVRTVKM